ncbi:lysine transporter LysE [Streptomyces tateyamensis]|uniref:Lysine transporter LysE n=1 Tax=Streptomyces tateyamensis TaxID=565073 RepID=A0A2V4N5K5_9ACTN|nr:LysE family transporter [Streptomyces tateyamensis]PYC76816.1 lysine transporter LysE [Streptomyces tateyamensis]
MTGALLAGLWAGYGIAVPVGAIGALLVGLAARAGWRVASAAALGVATADGVYAALAVLGGQGLVEILEPVSTPLRWAAVAVLLVIAARTARAARRSAGTSPSVLAASPSRAYLALLGLTLLNPATVVYFAALVLGGRVAHPGSATLFVLAAFLASASWQLLLATGGSVLGRLLTTPGARLATALLASALIAGLALRLLFQ